MVIFAGGKFPENVGKTFHVGVKFSRYTSPISFIKAHGFYFRVAVIFAKTTKARKMRKYPPPPAPVKISTFTVLLYQQLLCD